MSEILTKMNRARARRTELDQRTRDLILEARRQGLSWRTIGTALGIGHETARRLVRENGEDAEAGVAPR